MNELETLKTENEKLKRINAGKSDLISVSAHQLRTSMSALKWILQMFIDKDLGKMTGEQEEFIKKAIESNERMLGVVNDLLTLNHTDDISIKFELKETNIQIILEQVLFEFYGETHKKCIDLIYLKPDTSIPDLKCDKDMIRVVFQNLVENAIKYSTKDTKVLVSLKHDITANTIEFSVHDNGIGIKTEDQSQIFNKFFRTQNAIQKEYVGSGLGLYTTKDIVERHKGKIWFESNNDSGTTFFVSLPII